MQTCFLIEADASVELVTGPEGFEPGRDIVVCWNYLAFLKLKKLGLPGVMFVEEFFSREDYSRLHSACDGMASAWHLADGQDLLLHEDVPYGSVSEIILFRYYCQNVLVKLGCLVGAIKRRYPGLTGLVHDFSNASNAFHYWINDKRCVFNKEALIEHVSRALGLSVTRIVPPSLIPPATVAAMPREDEAYITLTHRLAHTALKALNCFKPFSLEAIYCSQYFNQASMKNAFSGKACYANIKLSNILSSMRHLDFNFVQVSLTEEDQDFLGRIEIQAEVLSPARSPKAYLYEGLDFLPFFSAACRDLLAVHIPRLVRYARKVRTGLKKNHITQLISNDIMTERGKTQAAVCKSCNVELVFVDHGVQALRHVHACSLAFAPDLVIKPDSFDSASEGYPYGLTAPAVQLGNPCTDPYLAVKRKYPNRLETILMHTFADNYYARLDRISNQERYYAELFPAVQQMLDMGLRVIYRPHNENQAYHDYLFRFFGLDKSRLVVSPWSKPFRELIYEVDCLVGNISTTHYEALAAGVPAVFFDPAFNPEAYFPPMTGRNYDEVIRISSGQELVDLVSRNRLDALELRKWLDHFLNKHATRYLGPLDGGASRRIATVLEKRTRL